MIFKMYFLFFTLSFVSLAEVAHLSHHTANIILLDKLYSDKKSYDITVNQPFRIGELTVNVQRCIKNSQNQEFAFLKVTENKEEILKNWVSIQENNSVAMQHRRYDITVQSCNFYKEIQKESILDTRSK
jgi:hypothetical protein